MPTPCWLKHLCSIRALVPVYFSVCLSVCLSFSVWSPGAQRPSEFTFLPGLLRPSRESALRLHSIERVPEASVNRASPVPGALLAFFVNQGISASFSPLLIIDSRPPGSGPLKDLNTCVESPLVVGRGCLLWPVCSLGKTLLAFALLHSVFQGQICLLLQVFLDFLLLHSSPL